MVPVLSEVDSVDAAHDAALGEELEHLIGGGGEGQTSGLDHASLGHFELVLKHIVPGEII